MTTSYLCTACHSDDHPTAAHHSSDLACLQWARCALRSAAAARGTKAWLTEAAQARFWLHTAWKLGKRRATK